MILQEARKSIELLDNVDPVRVAKIGIVYIYPGQVKFLPTASIMF